MDECVQRLLDVLRREGVLEGGITDPSGLQLASGVSWMAGWRTPCTVWQCRYISKRSKPCRYRKFG